MISNLKLFVLSLFSILMIQSCGDDDDGGVVTPPATPEVIAGFTQDVQSETGVVTFTNTSQNANSFAWDFGDGNSSTETSPTYTYTESGMFTVTLTASNSDGESDLFESSVTISIPEAFDSGLVANGDFETVDANGNVTDWIVGVDPNAPAPTAEEGGNRFYTVDVTNPDAGQVFLVNVSQLLSIDRGNVYRLQFDAWSDVDRSIIAGIGLSDGDFSNTTSSVNINTERTTYELTLCADNFGAANARIIFDLNGEAGTVNLDNVGLFLVDDSGTCGETQSTNFDDGLLSNGDFQSTDANGNVTNWIVGVDDAIPAPTVVDNGDRFYSVSVTSPSPDEPFLVNLSQRVEILEGRSYTLQFEAWSDVDRNIIAGIGLSGGDFASATELVGISTTRTVYELTLNSSGFGAPDARVLFDLNGDAGTVNIDNVALFLEESNAGGGETGEFGLIQNGDWESIAADSTILSWIVGVDDNVPAPTAVMNGNRFYSVDVTNPDPDQPFLINTSQRVEIVVGTTYILEFEAWSDVERTIIAGIGLSGGDFSSSIETVAITPTPTVYTLTLTANGFGAADARVLFDVNGEAGMVGIDNVTLNIQ